MDIHNSQVMDGVYRTDIAETRLQDGVFVSMNGERVSLLVSGENKLAQITGVLPGSKAHTAGYKKMWELDTDGSTWVEF